MDKTVTTEDAALVERVAAALYEKRYGVTVYRTFATALPSVKEELRDYARAAIGAIQNG